MRDRGIGGWIERRAQVAPDRLALVHGETARTYAEFAERVHRLAHGLRDLSVGHGDRVGWLGANHPAFLELLFATAKLGAVLAPVNHRLDHGTIGALLKAYSPTVVVVERSAEFPLPPEVRCVRVGTAVASSDDSLVDIEHLVAESRGDAIDEHVALDDLCMLPHTSGTTGVPKGVMLTHGNVIWNVVNFLSVGDFRSDDVTVAVAPFFRTGGIGTNVLPTVFKGGTVIVPETEDSEDLLDLIERRRVTIGFGNPDLLEALVRSPRWPKADLSSIRVFMTGGAPVPEHLIHSFMKRGVTFLQGYGLSEAAPLVLMLDAESAVRKVGSAGKPPLFVDVRIVGPDGRDCTPHETGELFVSGPNIMAGYWKRADATRAAVDDQGWLHSGDAARVDDEGFVWIVGRIDDSFRVRGRIVHPGDVERVLEQHPAVVEAGVVAGHQGGEAFVVLEPGARVKEEELLEFCRSRLAPHEVPSTIIFLDRLPRTSVGKLLRHELEALVCDDRRSTP
jgi:fatty-acyl-CoA synthase